MLIAFYVLLVLIAFVILDALRHAWNKNNKLRATGHIAPQLDPNKPYTNFHYTTILTAIFIALTTLLAFAGFSIVRDKVSNNRPNFHITWQPKDTVFLKSGPGWFYYNPQKATLNSLQPINEKDKTVLVDLLNKDAKSYASYSQAIDELTFTSNADGGNSTYCWLLLLYCITGVAGVQMRTINNFVGNACFARKFDFSVWWPWYLLRPLIGFITGGVVFLLIDGKLFYSTAILNGLSPLVVALAFLGGFSADDFYGMVRNISKRVFNPESDKKEPPQPQGNVPGAATIQTT